jgi:hypothetical protein
MLQMCEQCDSRRSVEVIGNNSHPRILNTAAVHALDVLFPVSWEQRGGVDGCEGRSLVAVRNEKVSNGSCDRARRFLCPLAAPNHVGPPSATPPPS